MGERMETKQKLTENNMVEQPAIKWLKSQGYSYVHGSKLTPEEGERKYYRHVILKKRFINTIKKINPWVTDDLAEKVYNKISDIDHPDFMIKSKIFYEMLANGVKIKDDIKFFEMIKKMIVKYSSTSKGVTRELEYEINTLISKSISASEPIDVFALMNKEKPEVSIFDEKFLEEFRNMPYKNYAAEVLIKIISDQIKVKTKINPIRYKSLYEKLKDIIEKHNLKLISTVEIIEELINIAREIKKQYDEGKKLDLTEEELAFYDLLSSKEKFFDNEEEIKRVAKEIIKELSGYIKIKDWKRKEF